MGVQTKWMRPSYKAIKFRDIFTRTKTSFCEKETNHELMKDDEGMVVLTQKGENENLAKNIFRVMGGNERLFTLIKPQGNDRVTAWSLAPNFVAWYHLCFTSLSFCFYFLSESSKGGSVLGANLLIELLCWEVNQGLQSVKSTTSYFFLDIWSCQAGWVMLNHLSKK